MPLIGILQRCLLLPCLLLLMLFASMDLSFGQQAEGGVPFFNDSGSITLPPQSAEELEESMPELTLFPPSSSPSMLPALGDSMEAPPP